uniref:Ubiquitin-like domain-containing protein n=1 Tax=Gopherus agassizii TaxID=38772 RepID=A0A452HSZ8_9SAUR
MELYQVPAGSLDAWIAEHLQPSEEFQLQVKDTVRRICDFLKETCFDDIKVFKTVKGGSAGKGTALKNNSDADLVLFLSCFSSYRDQMENRVATIAFSVDMEVSQPKEKGTFPRSLSITIQLKRRWASIEVDVLPAYNALGLVTPGIKPSPQVYEDLIRARAGPGEFCTSFTELQRDFVKCHPAKLKNLLRLVKHWYKEVRCPALPHLRLPPPAPLCSPVRCLSRGRQRGQQAAGMCQQPGLRAGPHSWERGSRLGWLSQGAIDRENLLCVRSPVILDPANPTGTLGQGKSWDLLAREAAKCRDQLCCRNGLAPICCWDVQPARPMQVMVKQLSGVSLALRLSPSITIWEIKEALECEWGISPYTQRLPQEMEIFVKDHNSRTIPYGVRASDTVLSLKKKIEGRTGVSASQQRLTFNSKELQDDYTLAHYRIQSKSTVFLLLRLRGG